MARTRRKRVMTSLVSSCGARLFVLGWSASIAMRWPPLQNHLGVPLFPVGDHWSQSSSLTNLSLSVAANVRVLTSYDWPLTKTLTALALAAAQKLKLPARTDNDAAGAAPMMAGPPPPGELRI